MSWTRGGPVCYGLLLRVLTYLSLTCLIHRQWLFLPFFVIISSVILCICAQCLVRIWQICRQSKNDKLRQNKSISEHFQTTYNELCDKCIYFSRLFICAVRKYVTADIKIVWFQIIVTNCILPTFVRGYRT